MAGSNLTSFYLTDLLGGVLVIMLLLSKGWEIPTRRAESRTILAILISTLAGCLLDSLAWELDGRPGSFARVAVYLCNTLLFSLNVGIGPGCISILTKHINEDLPMWHHTVIRALCIAETALLVVNFFVPVVFSVDENNVYHRRGLFWGYMALEVCLVFYALAVYFHARSRGRLLRFFPAWLIVLPMLVAMLVQSMVYGVSLIWPCLGVSFCTLIVCLQRESVFIDKLTGVYNRYYLDGIEGLGGKRRRSFVAMMLDMNGFKEINDEFSHAEGDAALMVIADILTDAVHNDGTVVRYAGDEFVVLLDRPGALAACEAEIRAAIERYNETSEKPYRLSVAIGGKAFDAEKDDILDFMSSIDRAMYENKEQYYKTHPRTR